MTVNIDPNKPLTDLTQEGLLRLLNDVAKGGGFLPPGAFRDEKGVVYRTVREPTGRVKETRDAHGQVVLRQAIVRMVRRPVYISFDMSAQGVLEGKRKAQRSGLDFHHPTYGWLRNGCKREVEVAENLGSGAANFDMEYVVIEDEDDIGSSTATMQGVPNVPVETDDAPTSGLASFDDAMAADGAPREPATSGRRNREN